MYTKLFSPLTIRDVTLRNRIGMSPMCQYSATDGFANYWHMVHYGSRAVGGAGLIMQEATAVLPEGRITPGDLGIYREKHMEMYGRIISFIHEYGAFSGIQLAHAGRKAGCAVPWKGGKQLGLNEGGWETMGPSAIPFTPDDNPPREMDNEGITNVVAGFRQAAARAIHAGYDIIEIHAAHGYLIHEFLSPLSNHRTDRYGGSFENRIRLLRETVQAVRSVMPENMPLFVRISATDWWDDGWNVDEAAQLAGILRKEGVDLIDCSSGGLVPYQKILTGPGYQVPFSERIKKESGIMTSAVGLITSVQQAEEILQQEQADLILLGRQILRDPYFALHAAQTTGEEIQWPLQYLRAK